MTEKEIRALQKEALLLFHMSNNRNDEIILCEDGKQTTNTYPIWCAYEPDAKPLNEWVRGIVVHHDIFNPSNAILSFILKKKSNRGT